MPVGVGIKRNDNKMSLDILFYQYRHIVQKSSNVEVYIDNICKIYINYL